MSLVTCRECKRRVSSEAVTCPHCGVSAPAHRPPRATAPGANRTVAIGCLAIIAIGLVGSIVSSLVSSSRDAAAVRQAQSERDSLVHKYLTGTAPVSFETLLAAEQLLHASTAPATPLDSAERARHDRLHPGAATRLLDSAQHLLQATARSAAEDTTFQPAVLFVAMAAHGPMTPHDSARYRQLSGALQQREARQVAALARANAALRAEQRREMAKSLEGQYLGEGMDVTVTTSGANATTLRIKWILVSRPMAYQFSQNTELWENLRRMGFTRLEITDGYDAAWSWTIH